jgi:hypothetical protein
MKYEAPELTALLRAIDAIQNSLLHKAKKGGIDYLSPANHGNEPQLGYADWE